MAITTKWAPKAFISAFNKEIDLNSDTLKVKAYTSASFGFSRDDDQYLGDFTGTELSGGTYAVQTLDTPTINYDSATDRVYLDAGDTTFEALETNTTGIPRYFVCYDDSATSDPIIFIVDLGDDTTGVRHGTDLVLQWNASGIVGVTVG